MNNFLRKQMLKIHNVERETIADRLTGLLSYRRIAKSDKNVLIQAFMFFKQTRLSMVDCLLSARATHDELEIMMFDKALEKSWLFPSR